MKKDKYAFPFEVKAVGERVDEESGQTYHIIEGILSTDDVDQGDDRVEVQAVIDSFKEYGLPTFLHQHDGFSGMPLGIVTEYKRTENGVWIKSEIIKGIKFNDDIVAKARHGEYGGLSIGYKATEVEWIGPIRVIKELRIRDASLVVFPMNESAVLTGVKNIEGLETLKDIEKNLREEGGYSRKATEAIISKIKSLNLGEQEEEDKLGDQVNEDEEKSEKENEEIKNSLSTLLDELKTNKGN
jgi:hypothetical protein